MSQATTGLYEHFQKNFDEGKFAVFCFIFSVIIGGSMLLLSLYKLYRGGKSKARDLVLLLGPCGAGKTVLSYKLCTGETPETITSMKMSKLQYRSQEGSKIQHIVDYPGHIKLRSQLTDVLNRAKKIIFVVDSSRMQFQARDVSEFLYDLFTSPSMENGPPMLVVCNKSDVAGARPPARVKLTLQQELEKIRNTRQSMEVNGDQAADAIPLGREGQQFTMERDAPIKVTFAATSVKNNSIESVLDFINA